MTQLAVEWLLEELRGVVECPVVTLVPRKAVELFVRVDAAAITAKAPTLQSGLVAIQVYGADLEAVIDTIQTIRLHLIDGAFHRSDKLLGWDEEAGPHDFPDPDTPDIFRWQITGELFTTLT
ncbi:hypothetical protein [Corynebacterium auriscanis]|uniref:DUF3168 domain-containing protein n=1 Tax=Corynebacterium auriscanis TaxID=99807 RepID=A0A0A2DML6_9CORY|nr:hypothetical protein [Corynebacterium auriscanis]KGM18146.1 hypothetical protein MA47_09670 [Corynebacterium auriscanis]WJY73221.1 hypothetical protein CAURIC_08040 [Corynebacterium auriscanis]